MKNNLKAIALIPTRLGSTRLPSKPLLEIQGIPMIVHVYKRAKLSKFLDDVIICCDDKKILNIAKKFNAKALLTSKKHTNGTERIYEAYGFCFGMFFQHLINILIDHIKNNFYSSMRGLDSLCIYVICVFICLYGCVQAHVNLLYFINLFWKTTSIEISLRKILKNRHDYCSFDIIVITDIVIVVVDNV